MCIWNILLQIKSVLDFRKKVEYNVLLDNGYGMLSCGCYVWIWIFFLCKYIFVVINGRFFGVIWKNIFLSYSNLFFFMLDFDVVFILVLGFVLNEDDFCDEEDVEDDIIDKNVVFFGVNLLICKKIL